MPPISPRGIIDDISRLARGLMAHFDLRVKIGDAGGVLVSSSIEFGEDSDSQLVENLLASVSQHRRQENGEQAAKAPARKDISADFPLRGFVLCNDCSKPLTSCWSQGKNQKYPYYLCATKGCESYRKSIKRDELEGEFEGVLQRLEPSETLFGLVKGM